MGVWIETGEMILNAAQQAVTPCMGVWIETGIRMQTSATLRSHPVWVCGLKLVKPSVGDSCNRHTLYGCVD